jgi:Dyp-type peroxidase family
VFLRFLAAEPARRLIAALAPRVRNATSWGDQPPATTLNIAFTWAGLRALRLPADLLDSFPGEFKAGMGARAAALGDSGESAVQHWHPQLAPGALDALVTIYGADHDALRGAVGELAEALDTVAPGVTVAHTVEAATLAGAREHFGFRDGFSQPAIRDEVAGPRVGEGTPLRFGRWRDVAPGEFVLGYEDEDGGPPAAPDAPFDRNASFMVLRKLRQHVDRFSAFLRQHAGPDEERQRWLAAKMLGRWQNGTPLTTWPDGPGPDDVDNRELNAFRFGGDRAGLRCPVGAHVRRANPRDALGWQGRLTKRHRIVRRGMPYGPPPADRALDDGTERGLMFVCLQASIARQFEVVQGRWLNDGDAFGLGDDRDFLVGSGSARGKMTVPGDPPLLLRPQPDFVTTRGGDYFFVPSLTALGWLGGLPG